VISCSKIVSTSIKTYRKPFSDITLSMLNKLVVIVLPKTK